MAMMTVERLHDLFDENPEKMPWRGRVNATTAAARLT